MDIFEAYDKELISELDSIRESMIELSIICSESYLDEQINVRSKVYEQDESILLEASIKSVFDKIRELIHDIIEKMKDFINKIKISLKKRFNLIETIGDSEIKYIKNKLKKYPNYTYIGYDWDFGFFKNVLPNKLYQLDQLTLQTILKIDNIMHGKSENLDIDNFLENEMNKIFENKSPKDFFTTKLRRINNPDDEPHEIKLAKNIDEIIKFYNGIDYKSITSMLDENYKNVQSNLYKLDDKISDLNKYIMRTNINSDASGSDAIKNINDGRIITGGFLKAFRTLINTLSHIGLFRYTNDILELQKECYHVLREFINYKPSKVKENASIFEVALSMV